MLSLLSIFGAPSEASARERALAEECLRRRRAERRQPDYLDTYAVLAEAAAELKCAADTIYATRCIPEAMLDTTLARLAEAEKALRAIKERTT